MKIRSAIAQDLDTLNELMFQLHDEHHQQSPDYFKSAEEIEQEKSIARYLDNPECLVLVALDASSQQIVGFVSGHFCELISTVSQPLQMGSLDELYVLPTYRQQGVAQQLCDEMALRFEQYGIEEMFVEVWQFNQSALALYDRLGFEPHIHWLKKKLK
ncbi:GNAT family N-acetyltransferase [Vibrio cholerae]